MEEILASIRKIIAEDSAEAAPPSTPHLAVVSSNPPEERAAVDEEADAEDSLGARLARQSAGRASARAVKPQPLDDAVLEDAVEAADAFAEEEAEAEAAEAFETADLDVAETPAIDEAPEPIDEVEEDRPVTALAEADADTEAVEAMTAEPEPEPETERFEEPPAAKETTPAPNLSAIAAAMAVGESQVVHDAGRLLSPEADRAVHGAFDQLASTILGNQARTLEDLVKDMMRPMLQHWLDENLPVLVERLVREEIERVSRGRR